MSDSFSLTSYQFHLPEELIAQYPVTPRDTSRLMVINRADGSITEVPFYEISRFLQNEDCLVFNNTKVIPARIYGTLKGGGTGELLLIRQMSPENPSVWSTFVRPGRKLKKGGQLFFKEGAFCTVLDIEEGGERIVEFSYSHPSFEEFLSQNGEIPLPHYIRNGEASDSDSQQYQTVYASKPGAVAAPTAGLHFTESLLEKLGSQGVERSFVTLHVGPGTFKPVQVEDIRSHQMHREEFWIEPEEAEKINQSRGKVVAVGTTSCRSLESASNQEGRVIPGHYLTDIFIYPGYEFKRVDALLTNFHLPGSTLIMLVSAFMGTELTKEAYQKAIREKFRFYSYGDAMLIL